MPPTFGQVIADARKREGLSQKDLAARILKEDGAPISPQYLNDIEHDKRNAPPEHLLGQLAELLDLPPEFLYFKAGHWPEDLRGNESRPEQVARAFRAFRRELKDK